MDLFLSTRCPQCGADISFEEESTVVYCEYCGSALHITGRSGVMLTYLAPRRDIQDMKKAIRLGMKPWDATKALVKEKRLFFAPYWRVKGMVFRWIFGRNYRGDFIKELKAKQLDHTFPAYEGMNLGLRSLGVRPETLKLLLFDRKKMSEMGSEFKVSVAYQGATAHGASLTEVGLDEMDIRVHLALSRLIGERYSIIYFPFWMMKIAAGDDTRVLILDAVANRLIKVLTPQEWDEMVIKATTGAAKVSFSKLSFIPFKCPNCGWNLPLHRFDIIHLCGTCQQAWMEQSGRFRAVRFEVAAPPREGGGQGLVYFPFWVFQAEISSRGASLRTVADLRQFSLLSPTRPDKDAEERPLRFYVPAVGIRNMTAANGLGTRVTQNQPAFDQMPKDALIDSKLIGVCLPPKAAAGMAEVLLCSLAPNSRQRQDFIQHADVSTGKMVLVWWPFYEQRLFWRDAICQAGIQKGAMFDGTEGVERGSM